MSEVVAYRLILTAAILLFAGGAVLASRLTKRPIRQWADITAITMLIMAAVGSFLLLTATDKAGKTYERVPATVEGQHLGKHGEMILTVKTGFDGEERDIPCLPHQKACQAATTNDVVLIDGAYDFTGIRNNDEIRFIFSGPPR